MQPYAVSTPRRRPRSTRTAAVGAAAALVAGLGALAPPASAGTGQIPSDADDFTVVSSSATPLSIPVKGLASAYATVEAHLHRTTAPLPTGAASLWFTVHRDGATSWAHTGAAASQVSGDANDGVWRARIPMMSLGSGTWRFAGVSTNDFWGSGMASATWPVVGGATYQVVGTHQPKLTARTVPAVLPLGTARYTVAGRLVDTATGKGFAGVRIAYAVDSTCAEGVPSYAARTDASGRFTLTQPNGTYSLKYLNCVSVLGAPRLLWGTHSEPSYVAAYGWFPKVLSRLSVTPARTRVALGAVVKVATRMPADPDPQVCPQWLQRRYGDGSWRTVGAAKVRYGGRGTLLAQPPRRGTTTYRVVLPACRTLVRIVSKPFTITAT